MLKNYLKTAWRSLQKSKVNSIINITGLSVGMAVVMLIALWIRDELNFDKYHSTYDSVGQIIVHQNRNNEINSMVAVAYPLANELRTKYGEDFKAVVKASWQLDNLLASGDKKMIKNGMWVEPQFPEIFDLKMLAGSAKALTEPTAILISASLAKAYFGNEDPMNQSMRLGNIYDVKVAGVYEDLPMNTSLHEVQYLASWASYEAVQSWVKGAANQWDNHSFQCYVLLNKSEALPAVQDRIRNISSPYFEDEKQKEAIQILPMKDWHLRGEFKNGVQTGGQERFVWLFGTIGGFVLLLACINFMNLGTARSEKRAREVGVRKSIGSLRKQLIWQFLMESLLVAFLSMLLAFLLVSLSMPWFNRIAVKDISIPWNEPLFWTAVLGFTILTGLMAGSYPAFYLSSFKPVKVLKGVFKAGRFSALPRKVLVVLQFTVSIVLIIGTIVVFRQVQHARNRPMGFSANRLIQVIMVTDDPRGHYNAIRSDLLKTGVVADMGQSSSAITAVWSNQSGYEWQGKDPNFVASFGTIAVTHDYGNTVQWKMKEGRDFSREYTTDSASIVLNASAAKVMGFKNPIGEIVKHNNKPYKVIGVVNDVLMTSPYEHPLPSVYLLSYKWSNVILISIKPDTGVPDALSSIEKVFKKYDPSAPFDYRFVDELNGKKFAAEEQVGKLAGIFAALAIFISCLGIFGLASFVAEQRIKEIGIRKILGASVFGIWQLLSKDFCWLVLLSMVISAPAAWYFMNGWLQDYEYRTDLSWWIFAVSFGGAMLITIATVSTQAIRAAIANPVRSLKTE